MSALPPLGGDRTSIAGLPAPARYYPFASGRYEIAPGFFRFGRDFGNGPADGQAFQLDRDFGRYRSGKLAARGEAYERYICQTRLSTEVRNAVARFIVGRLGHEHPDHFRLHSLGTSTELHCLLTGESLRFDEGGGLTAATPGVEPPCQDALDALACQVQEDLAVISTDAAGRHWVSYLHLCFPNHWAAAEKIGRSFAEIHAPVAGIEPIVRRAEAHVQTMIGATEGLVRFAWGLTTDDELDHHPAKAGAAAGRVFDPANPRAFVRVERQTMWGFPQVAAALFTIRTSFIDIGELKRLDPGLRDALAAAIESMSAGSVRYKGLAPWRDALLEWLRADQV